MAVRLYEGEKTVTGGDGIEVTANKVINLLLRSENNLIKIDDNNDVYCDLQLEDGIATTDTLPVGVTTGRVLVADGWVAAGTMLAFKTTSGDQVTWIYGDDGKLYIDNGTGTFKQIYLKSEVDALFTQLRSELSTVAFSGSYNDLLNKPTLGTAAALDAGTQAGNVPVLDSNGKLDSNIVPSTGVMNTYTVTNKSDLTTISNAVKGDIAIVTSENKTYILSNNPYSTLSNWTELLFPTGSVSSVNGFTGAVNLTTGYIQETGDNLFVSSTEKQSWSSKLGLNNVATVATTGNYNDLNNKPVVDSAMSDSSTNAVQNKIIKAYVDSTSGSAAAGVVNDTAYAASWDGVTTIAPSKNAMYDKINAMDTTIAGKQDALTAQTAYTSKGTDTKVPTITTNTLGQVTNITETNIEGLVPTSGSTGQVLTKTANGYERSNSQGASYNAGYGIKIGESKDYSAMQGPCRSGFHIPSYEEVYGTNGILNTLTSISVTGDNRYIYLKMPKAGHRGYEDSNVSYQGTSSYYWTCTYGNNKILWNPSSSSISTPYLTSGNSIRPFCDTIIQPDSTWTTIYQNSSTKGIYHNPTLGVITIRNGSNYITIADKNCGAAEVWNDGDTLTEANCGKYFQWGNNYGFPWTGTLSNTSTTQVDASNYGPGNYYSSPTYICRSSSPFTWDSSDNENLWGGTTGVIDVNNAISVDNSIMRNISVSGATFSSFLEACQASGTKHEVTLESKYVADQPDYLGWKSYIMQGFGWIDCYTATARGSTVTIELNGFVLHTDSSTSSQGTPTQWEQKGFTVKPGDVIRVCCTAYTGSAYAYIKDFY